MILIAGGTGRLGSRVASSLSRRRHKVRVLSRGLAPVPDLADGVELVRGDVRDAATLVAPMVDVDVVVSAVQGFAGPGSGSPRTTDRDGNIHLIEAAEAAGARFILVSVIGASPNASIGLFRMKYAAEQRLRASSCRWTILRGEAYAETWTVILEESARASGAPLVFGRGDNPISWLSVEDMAALIELAVADDSLSGRILEICGPEPVSLTQLAAVVSARRGGAERSRRVPRPMLHLTAHTLGLLQPQLRRQALAALAMDTLPTAHDDALRAEFPALPSTPVSRVVAQM